MALKKTAEHKLTVSEKFLLGVLNTNLFSGNNYKKTSFSSPYKILLHNNKSQKNSRNFCQIAEFCGRIGRKTLPRPGNSGGGSYV